MTEVISKTKTVDLIEVIEGIQDNYRPDIKVLVRFLRENDLGFDLPSIQAYYQYQMEQYKSGQIKGATFNKRIAAVKCRLRMAIDREDLKASELLQAEHELKNFKAVKLNGLEVNPQNLPTEKELGKLIAETKDKLVRYMVSFLKGTGLRISEALGIRLTDMTKARGFYWITIRGKGMREREIMVSIEMIEWIRAAYPGETFLFEHGGKPYRRIPTNDRIRLQARLCLGIDFHAHTLRHCFATQALKQGMSLKGVSLTLGHSSTKVTADIYDHNRLTWKDLKNFTKVPKS